jgi:hypothetical protein
MKRSVLFAGVMIGAAIAISASLLFCNRDNPFDANGDNFRAGARPEVAFIDTAIIGFIYDTLPISLVWTDTSRGGALGTIKHFMFDWDGSLRFADTVSGIANDTLTIYRSFPAILSFARVKAVDEDDSVSAIDSIPLVIRASTPVITSINSPATAEKLNSFTITVTATDVGGKIVSFHWSIDEEPDFSKITDTGILTLTFDTPGDKNIWVKARDNKNVESDLRLIPVHVIPPLDTVGPKITFLAPLHGDTVATSNTIVYLNVTDISGVKIVTVNSIPFQLTGETWRGIVPLIKGANVLTAASTDIQGNVSSTAISVYCRLGALDQTPPAIILVSPPTWNDTVNTEPLTIKLFALDESGVASIFFNDLPMRFDQRDSSYNATQKLAEGTNRFVIRSLDHTGNSGNDTLTVVLSLDAVDNTPPAITFVSPVPFAHIRDSQILVRGTATDASKLFQVFVNSMEAMISYPDWSASLSLRHGNNLITVTATDKSPNRNTAEKELTVIQNYPPSFNLVPRDTNLLLGSVVSFSASAADPDGDVVNFTMLHAPEGGIPVPALSTSDTNVSFQYSATVAGIDTFRFIVTDPFGDADTARWRVFVRSPGDSTPLFTTDTKTLPKIVLALDTVRVTVHAIDPNNQPIVYSILRETMPSGMTIDSLSGTIVWTPAESDTGNRLVIVRAGNGRQFDSLEWRLTVLSYDYPPVLSFPGNQTVNESQLLQITLHATDANNDPLDFSFGSTFPAGARLDSNRFNWIPADSDAGVYTVVFVVRERNRNPSLTDSAVISITVNNVNQPPVLVNPGTITGVVNQAMTFTLSATDPDGNTLIFSMNNAPSGSSLNGNRFTWTPTFSQSGTVYVNFIALDNGTPPLSDTITVALRVNSANGAPTLANPGNKTVNETQLLQFNLAASDPNNDSLIYGMINAPTGATLSGNTFSWRPTYTQSGTYSLSFVVRDNVSPPLSDTQIIVITVNNVNAPPVMISPGNKSINENQKLGFFLQATDIDNNPITYSMANGPSGAYINGNWFEWTPSFSQAGTYRVTFYAMDNGIPALRDSQAITITVIEVNRTPVFTDSAARSVLETQRLSFQLLAYDPDGTEVRYVSTNLPAGATLTVQGIFSWTPTYDQAGTYPVKFIVRDTTNPNAILTDTATIRVTVNNLNRPPVFTDSTPHTVNEGQTVAFQLLSTDSDGNALNFVASNLPTGAALTQAGAFSWTPGYTQSGTYAIIFIVLDNTTASAALSDTATIRITVKNVNRPPVFNDSAARAINENQEITFQLQANDPDGTTPRFASNNLPSGASLTLTGAFSWKPAFDQAGIYPVLFIARDSSNPAAVLSDTTTIRITVNDVNRAPVFTDSTSRSINEGQALSFQLQAGDPDGTPVRFVSANLPTGATLTLAGAFSWTPSYQQANSYGIPFIARDSSNPAVVLSDTATIRITVNNVNRPPAFTSTAITAATEGIGYSYSVNATDPDSDPLTYSLTTFPTGMTIITGTGVISWTPSGTQAGSHPVTVSVSDGVASVTQSFTIAVAEGVNNPPVITSTPVTTATEGIAYSYDVNATDADNNTLSYTLSAYPAGMTINSANGVISWTPSGTQAGSRAVEVSVSDGQAATTQTFTIIVAEAINNPPTMTSIAITSATEGVAYSYDVNATDADGDVLTYKLTVTPAGMTIDTATGLISWTPSGTQSGSHNVTVKISDGKPGGTTDQSFTIAVAEAINNPPKITSTPVTAATEGVAYSYTVQATDPDHNTLTFNLSVFPSGMGINSTTGLITWTPSSIQAGVHPVSVIVSDGSVSGRDTQSFAITVTEALNNAPVITSTEVTTATEGTLYTYTVQASDADNDNLIYTLSIAPTGMVINGTTGVITWTPSGQMGNNNVTVMVSDGRGGAASQDFIVRVAPAAARPE